MKRSKSILVTVALGALLAAGSTTVTMAREVPGHRMPGHALYCADDADRGFGGFSATPDHSFMGPGKGKDWGTDWGVDNWSIDPFWARRATDTMRAWPTLCQASTDTDRQIRQARRQYSSLYVTRAGHVPARP